MILYVLQLDNEQRPPKRQERREPGVAAARSFTYERRQCLEAKSKDPYCHEFLVQWLTRDNSHVFVSLKALC